MGALLSVRVVKLVTSKVEELKKLPIYFWVDSSCVLGWILNQSQTLKVFVQNRVQEIHTIAGSWKWCPGLQNPADLSTRGVTAGSLCASSLWRHGPAWLIQEDTWPVCPEMLIKPQFL